MQQATTIRREETEYTLLFQQEQYQRQMQPIPQYYQPRYKIIVIRNYLGFFPQYALNLRENYSTPFSFPISKQLMPASETFLSLCSNDYFLFNCILLADLALSKLKFFGNGITRIFNRSLTGSSHLRSPMYIKLSTVSAFSGMVRNSL